MYNKYYKTEQKRTEHILLRNLYKHVSRYKHMKTITLMPLTTNAHSHYPCTQTIYQNRVHMHSRSHKTHKKDYIYLECEVPYAHLI